MPRIYTPQALSTAALITLEAQASHYVSRVLRCTTESNIEVFNGDGFSYTAVIRDINKRAVQIEITAQSELEKKSPLDIHLGIGISKGDRMDTVMQKCTELGVQSITPLITQHLAYKLKPQQLEKKQAHWQQIIISACEQSQQNLLPSLHQSCGLHSWLEANQADLKLCLDPRSDKRLVDFSSHKINSLLLLIGPEGGLSETEVATAVTQEFEKISLGPRILRTETAPIAVASIAQYIWGDF